MPAAATKTPKPVKPWVSGFCNPGNGPASHRRCEQHPRDDGKVCACPTCRHGQDPAPDGLRVVPDLESLTVEQTIDLFAAAAKQVLALRTEAITDLDWVDAVRQLDQLRQALWDARAIESALVHHIYMTGEHGDQEVDGIGMVKVTRSRDRRHWDERGVARAVIDARMADSDGTAPDPWDVAEWLLEVYGVDYCRVTPLRALGLEPKAFCDDTPGTPSVQLPRRN